MAPTATLDVADGVAVITLANPPVNALHPDGEIVLFCGFVPSFDGDAATHADLRPRTATLSTVGGRGRRRDDGGRAAHAHKTAAHCHAPAQRGFWPPAPSARAAFFPHSASDGRVRLTRTLWRCRSGRRGRHARSAQRTTAELASKGRRALASSPLSHPVLLPLPPTHTVLHALFDCLRRAHASPAVVAIVVTGSGDRAFSAGFDINQFAKQSGGGGIDNR